MWHINNNKDQQYLSRTGTGRENCNNVSLSVSEQNTVQSDLAHGHSRTYLFKSLASKDNACKD